MQWRLVHPAVRPPMIMRTGDARDDVDAWLRRLGLLTN